MAVKNAQRIPKALRDAMGGDTPAIQRNYAEKAAMLPPRTGRNPPVPVGKGWQAIGDSRMASGRSRLRVAVRTIVKTRERTRRRIRRRSALR